ncbi:olfactory receptor 6N2-like [Epinephelus lanceolatus]|uniref:olfactory receptor 6N2-like n=1 Tax=Epinephelus lanceolatus TaxID=310571 RepID=UPI001444B3F6|nr:olfactory receptor 6N2-like [Epinephelus lanceolatus]
MDDELNVTYITFGGHVEVDKYRYVYFVIMFIVYVLIICSNSTIVYLIWVHKNLHEPMYIFIAALLLNSVLFSTAVYPKLLIDFLSEKQIISYSACLFQFHVFYSLGGSEFLLLAVMAYDRYVSICRPLKYPTIMTKTTVSIFLVLAWVLPACQMAVPAGLSANEKLCTFTLKGVFCNNTVYKLQCVISKARFVRDMIILVNVALVPVLFILFTYTRIFLITYQNGREVRKKAAQTCLPHLIVLVNLSCLCVYDVIIVGLEPVFPEIVHLIMTLQIVLYHPLFNPIMYGVKMKEISKHLKRLFCQAKMK